MQMFVTHKLQTTKGHNPQTVFSMVLYLSLSLSLSLSGLFKYLFMNGMVGIATAIQQQTIRRNCRLFLLSAQKNLPGEFVRRIDGDTKRYKISLLKEYGSFTQQVLLYVSVPTLHHSVSQHTRVPSIELGMIDFVPLLSFTVSHRHCHGHGHGHGRRRRPCDMFDVPSRSIHPSWTVMISICHCQYLDYGA